MMLNHNQLIELFSQHLCLARGESLDVAWAYFDFAYQLSKMRVDIVHTLEDELCKQEYQHFLDLYEAYHLFFPEYGAIELEQIWDKDIWN